MTNIFSLRNGFISIDLGKSFSKNNQIYFKNISFLNEENAFNNYLKSLIRLSDAEITQVTSKSGFIFISNSKVDFEDIHFSGSWIGPINQLENIQNVTFLKNTFNNIQTIQSLLNIKLQDQNHLTLKQINMRNIKQIISNASTHNNLQKLEYDLSSQIDCQLHFRQDMVVLQQNKQEILLIDPQQLIFQLQNQIQGFIIISQNKNNILISNSYFQELSCTQCKYGGIYIESSQYSNTTIINTIFKQSSYKSAGSVYIMGDQTNFIKIETCKFQENSCQYGCGISISNSITKIANSEFIKNQAIGQGAGLQFDGLHLNLTTTSFLNNTAQIGSAIPTNFKLIISLIILTFKQGKFHTLTNAFSLDCWLSRQDYVDVLYLRMFLLVLLSLFFINVFVSGYLVFLSIKKTKYDSSTFIIAVIYIFIITQPDNIKYSSSLVASRTISDVRWIQQNISYLYDTDTHYQWITLAIVPLIIIWGILIPLFLTFILFHNRNNLSKIAFRRNWSYLFQEYQTKSYFWEIVKIVSRELQILVLTVFKQETLNNICLLFFIEFMYLTLIGKIQPYNMEELNQLEIQSVQKSILILILGLFTFSANNGYIKIISEFMLVFTTMSLILPFLFKLLKIYFNKYLISFRNLIKNYGFMKKLLNLTSQDLDKKRRARERFQKIKAKLLERVQTFQRFERVYNESLVTDQTTNTFNRRLKKISLQMN